MAACRDDVERFSLTGPAPRRVTGSGRPIQIYYADRRAVSEDLIAALVTADDRRRLTTAMRERRRGEYLAARALLRYALADYTRSDAAALRIEVAPGGKPECVGGPAISLSHSGDVLVCALANAGAAVGIDVETRSPRQDRADIAERYFTSTEAQWLAADAEPRFRMLWTLKEAHLKALGVGLAGGLSSLECRIEPPSVGARTADGGVAPQLALLEGQGCHVGVAAFRMPEHVEFEIRRFSGGEPVDAVGPLRMLARTA